MSDIPIPAHQLHYADPAVNDEAQLLPIIPFVDRIHYPTLGAPALLTAKQPLVVLLSLPQGEDPAAVSLSLVDRHGGTGERPLSLTGAPSSLGLGPHGKHGRRELWRLPCALDGHSFRLFDLRVRSGDAEETQPNAVRVFEVITGDEKVVFCGDAQYHVRNAACLERFVDSINRRDDIAWVALIGDVCDNGVRGVSNVLRLALTAKPEPVRSYYVDEFRDTAGRILPALNKPIVLIPGNHDGMVAFEHYSPGTPTDVYLDPDPGNAVAYDGLHHFRRSFGPLYHAFTWHRTRYICANSFELDRHDRAGYHAVVANWGGWVRDEQLGWLEGELAAASADGLHKVVLVHHDPRGGCRGRDLGWYSEVRRYTVNQAVDVVGAYLRYLAGHARTWQQEWMARPGQPIAEHPVRRLLSALLEHRVWAVLMGHDNENWVETYVEGDTLFTNDPVRRDYPPRQTESVDPALVLTAADLLGAGELPELATRLDVLSDREADTVITLALERLDAEGAFERPASYAPGEVEAWRLQAKAPIHFAHVDDVGAYAYAKETDFTKYGYVVAQLHEGRPILLQHFDLRNETPGAVVDLIEKAE